MKGAPPGFLLCYRYHVYLLMKKIKKILTHFGDANFQKKKYFLAARDVQLDNVTTCHARTH